MEAVLKNGTRVGKASRTALSVLVGFNHREEHERSCATIESMAENHADGVSIVGDVSLCSDGSCTPVWEMVLERTPFAAATVPTYQAFQPGGSIDRARLIDTICKQAEAGVSIITIHATVSISLWEHAKRRLIPCTSRGGAMVIASMLRLGVDENPFMHDLDAIASVARKTNTVLSIGSTFRAGSVIDGADDVCMAELADQIRLSEYLQARGVSTLIETPGHASAASIASICTALRATDAPIMPLGPMLTDIGFEHDDLVGCAGAILMGVNGCADILTVVTRDEHAGGIPSYDTLDEAIRKYRIAAHIIDMQKVGDVSADREVSELRARTRSCVTRTDANCDRCSFACPLKLMRPERQC